MSSHDNHTIERHCDVCVVGGSAAGLAAALQLGRQRRSVIVVDAGEPRNAPAAHMHGFLSRDGQPPAELTAAGREEVRRYGGEVVGGLVTQVSRTAADTFRVELASGHAVVARRVLAATGIVDELPAIDGLVARWGRDVIHCPFCHGYEVRDRRVVQVVTHPAGLHSAVLFRQLTARLTVVLHGQVAVDEAEVDALRGGGVTVVRATVARLVADDDHLTAVEPADGERIEADAVVVVPRFHVRAEP
ncbi:MAG: FAD-dependent oxidoreductase, partial [Trebonia sp.]